MTDTDTTPDNGPVGSDTTEQVASPDSQPTVSDAPHHTAATPPAPDTDGEATTPDVVDESGPEKPDLPVAPVTAQFPALEGSSEGAGREVRQRTSDSDSDGTRFTKEFRIFGSPPANGDERHRVNAAAVVQDAMQRGLHPRGDVYLTYIHETDEPLNPTGVRRRHDTVLRYEVDVIPASVDTHTVDTTTPTVIYQAARGGDVDDGPDNVGDSDGRAGSDGPDSH